MAVRPKPINYRSVALPAEHGAWGFLLEPILLGLILAFTIPGLLLSVAVFATFLVHQPLKIALKDHLKSRSTPRSTAAWRFSIGYGLVALAMFVGLLVISSSSVFWIPLLAAAPLALFQVSLDARNRSRTLAAELAGALALGAVASSIVLLDGWTLVSAALLWVLLAIRAVSSVVYVRAKLRLERGKPAPITQAYVIHALCVIVIVGLAFTLPRPVALIAAGAILAARAYVGLPKPEGVKPKVVGFREMALGAIYMLLIAIAFL